MELDSSTIVYVIAVIVYFLYSTFFSKKTPEDTLPEENEEPRVPPKKQVSFDELLKEIRREQGERERDLEGAKYGEEKQEEERHYVPDPTPAKVYSRKEEKKYSSHEAGTGMYNQSPYKSYEREPLVKLDDQVDIESTEKILGDVEDVANEYSSSNKYGELLKNPETVRDAIVLSEILNRKHF